MNKEKKVCLKISNFIFSFPLFFTIDLYSFIPLTDIANIPGIVIILCNNIDDITNTNPL